MKRDRGVENDLEEAQDLPTDSRIQLQLSYGTIRQLIDAVVELVTNSDDSYRRLEQEGVKTKGKILVRIRRLKYGKCENLQVTDWAEGMDNVKLKKALEFAGEASGFEEGKSVRGLFGRGLKEAIIALGEGEICTVRDDRLSRAILWRGPRGGKYRPPKESRTPSKQEREGIGIIRGNGSVVRIKVTNEKIKCPDYKTFLPQFMNHYALRDINSAANREVVLEFEAPEKRRLRQVQSIKFERPKGKKVIEQSVSIPGYEDDIEVTIYESNEELESPYNNPFARAGLLIKTSGAILDNQLFKHQNERAGRFFYGEVKWPNLAERLRSGESLLDLNRVGIEWRQEVCQSVQNELERILEPLVEKKRMEIEVKHAVSPPEKVAKLNRDVCSLLNRLAKKHMSELPPGGELSDGEEMEIQVLTIKPPYANIQVGKERYFSVYAPASIVRPALGWGEGEVKSDNLHIQVLDPVVRLMPHSKYPHVHYGRFRIIGRLDKEDATVTCRSGEHVATAIARVAPPGKIGKRKGPKGGFFHHIKPDSGENPDQRARYDENDRTIWICTRFPGINKYFKENLAFESAESKPMYAELVGEAFCRFIARHDVEYGKIPRMPGQDIDAFVRALSGAQQEYLHLIHRAILKYRLK